MSTLRETGRQILERVTGARIEAARRRREPWAWPAAEIRHAAVTFKPHLRMKCRQHPDPILAPRRIFSVQWVCPAPDRLPVTFRPLTSERWGALLPEDWESMRQRLTRKV